MKLPLVYRDTMRRFGFAVVIMVVVMIGLQLFSLLFASSMSWDDIVKQLYVTLTTSFGALTVFGYLIVPYSEFKLGMQNGQTRRQIWLSQFMGVITLSFITCLLWLTRDGNWAQVGMAFLGQLSGISTMLAIGNGFALLSRKWKLIVGIGGPIALIALLVRVITWMVKYWHPSEASMQHLADVLTMHGSSVSLVIYSVIWILIMLLISYGFMMRMQLRRD